MIEHTPDGRLRTRCRSGDARRSGRQHGASADGLGAEPVDIVGELLGGRHGRRVDAGEDRRGLLEQLRRRDRGRDVCAEQLVDAARDEVLCAGREVERSGDDVADAFADALGADGEIAHRAADAARKQRGGTLNALRLLWRDVEAAAGCGVLRAEAGRCGGGCGRCGGLRRNTRERALNVRRREVVGEFVLLTFEIDDLRHRQCALMM
ncbi:MULTISPECIES: hypothetical protein [unclassified Bradyrhizobium]|uniref:hypothetical protein n=1 Tax=unclassified Bradyrhizobium TaxID=2631580 RepID=UPI001FF9FCE0|nr:MULTISPECIES: hypothetical protein [unclassified Bradyrhizobium]MCK1306483.1 hypothetical protein [Bradyrhizobium sp. 45]MCK1436890.1 hypothetical protein [Bradyrhizobium sp. 15]MCK1600818.1 hypothetical protein [Bradyrhizobium sp. 166]MCK1608043.1 hypothetical protein [Bradyrhizobium sp. 163]MCK1766599.1 hypothetical protein [Bradyrhizobium sp. 136]